MTTVLMLGYGSWLAVKLLEQHPANLVKHEGPASLTGFLCLVTCYQPYLNADHHLRLLDEKLQIFAVFQRG